MDPTDRLSALMCDHCYEIHHTGRGCMAWRREEAGSYWLLTYEDCEVGTWADRNTAKWTLGRYRDDDSWVCTDHNLTLSEALAITPYMPTPRAGEQRIIDALQPSNWLIPSWRVCVKN